jgi:hypothetical protein
VANRGLGSALSLRIVASNMPNFVDLETGGWGAVIQDPLNSSQTPTMANFATIADALSGCITMVTDDACDKLFAATTPPAGATPTDTLTAAEAIAKDTTESLVLLRSPLARSADGCVPSC